MKTDQNTPYTSKFITNRNSPIYCRPENMGIFGNRRVNWCLSYLAALAIAGLNISLAKEIHPVHKRLRDRCIESASWTWNATVCLIGIHIFISMLHVWYNSASERKGADSTIDGDSKNDLRKKVQEFLFKHKELLKKMSFTTVSSTSFEMLVVRALALSTGSFATLICLRMASYVFSEIMWSFFNDKEVSSDELRRIAKGVIEFPILSTAVDYLLKPFFVNFPIGNLFKPLQAMRLKDGSPLSVISYLKYFAKNGLVIFKEKVIAFGVKFSGRKVANITTDKAAEKVANVSNK